MGRSIRGEGNLRSRGSGAHQKGPVFGVQWLSVGRRREYRQCLRPVRRLEG